MTTKCKAQVWPVGAWRNTGCARAAKLDGYCKQHHPDTVKARQDERDAKFAHERAVMNARDALARAERAVLDEVVTCDWLPPILALRVATMTSARDALAKLQEPQP